MFFRVSNVNNISSRENLAADGRLEDKWSHVSTFGGDGADGGLKAEEKCKEKRLADSTVILEVILSRWMVEGIGRFCFNSLMYFKK